MDDYLKARVSSWKTILAYTNVARQIEDSSLSPEAWLDQKVTPETPKPSIAVYRGAVLHYLSWQRWKATGTDPTDEERFLLGKRLTPTRRGRAGVEREAPTAAQFELFARLVEDLEDPHRSILKLLPHTGLRISEACGLRLDSIRRRDGRTVLKVIGKGNKERLVPLGREAEIILATYLQENEPAEPWLFWRPATIATPTRQIRSGEVERAMQELRGRDVRLDGIVPHSFRHLYASAALKGGVDIRTVQRFLGHANMATTMRYLHPDHDMLTGSADVVSSVLARYTKG